MARLLHSQLLLLKLYVITAAQNCYYPNGDVAEGDGACSSSGGTCCPYQWDCLSNGLCYLDNANYYGRYTCTDETWQSGNCPQICTQNGTAAGNEAILHCSDGSWCCDGDRSFNCCSESDTDFFNLPSGSSIAYISSTGSPTSVISSSSSLTSPSQVVTIPDAPVYSTGTTTSLESTSTSATTAASSRASKSTTTFASTSSGSNGQVSTVTIVSVADSTQTLEPSPTGNPSNNNTSLTVGLAVGIPLAAILATILAFFLIKRRKREKAAEHESQVDYASRPDMATMYGHFPPEGRAPELDSFPVAPVRTKSGRHSELMGSMHSPKPSTPTNSSGSPPVYSPAISGGVSSMSTPATNMASVSEAPVELWGGYVPYRPSREEPHTRSEEKTGDAERRETT